MSRACGEMHERVDCSFSVKRAHEMALKVDVHNQRRQGQLQAKTVHWVLRIFATILGMIETDAYLVYSLTKRNEMSHNQFKKVLVEQLVKNTYGTLFRQAHLAPLEEDEAAPHLVKHTMGRLADLKRYQGEPSGDSKRLPYLIAGATTVYLLTPFLTTETYSCRSFGMDVLKDMK